MSCQQKSFLDLFSNLSKDHFDQLLSSNTLPFIPWMVLSEYLICCLLCHSGHPWNIKYRYRRDSCWNSLRKCRRFDIEEHSQNGQLFEKLLPTICCYYSSNHCFPFLLRRAFWGTWKALLYAVTSTTAAALRKRPFSSPVNRPGRSNKVSWQVCNEPYSCPNFTLSFAMVFSLENKGVLWLVNNSVALHFTFKRPGPHLPFSQASCVPSMFARY